MIMSTVAALSIEVLIPESVGKPRSIVDFDQRSILKSNSMSNTRTGPYLSSRPWSLLGNKGASYNRGSKIPRKGSLVTPWDLL
jgi:hypothetical protein